MRLFGIRMRKESTQTSFSSSESARAYLTRASYDSRGNIVTRIRRSCTLFAAFSTPVRRNEVCRTVSQTSRLLRFLPHNSWDCADFPFSRGGNISVTRKHVHRDRYKRSIPCYELRDVYVLSSFGKYSRTFRSTGEHEFKEF